MTLLDTTVTHYRFLRRGKSWTVEKFHEPIHDYIPPPWVILVDPKGKTDLLLSKSELRGVCIRGQKVWIDLVDGSYLHDGSVRTLLKYWNSDGEYKCRLLCSQADEQERVDLCGES